MTVEAAANERRTLLPALLLGGSAAMIAVAPDARVSIGAGVLLFFGLTAVWTITAASRWIVVFIAAAWLLPPLPIEAGNSGPHVAVAIAALGLLAGIVRPAEWQFRSDGLSASMLWLLVAFAASVPFAFAWSGLVIGAGSAVRLGLFAIAVYTYLYIRFGPGKMSDDQVRRTVRAVLWIGAFSASIACIDFYFQLPAPAGYGAQFVWLDSGVFRRAQGVFYEASTLGNLCAFLIQGIAVALVIDPVVSGFRRITLVLLSVPLIVALVLSYSRASILNLVVGMLVLFWMKRGRLISARPGIAAVALTAAGAGILIQVFPSFFEAYVIRAFASLQYFVEAPNSVLSGRLSAWMALAQFIVANPFMVLAGTGYKTLAYSGIAGNAIIADNTWLSVLIETGIAGFLGLICLNIAILAECYRSAQGQNPVRSFLGTWFLCFWSGQMVQMLSADLLTYWRLLPVYFCVLALATSDNRQPSRS